MKKIQRILLVEDQEDIQAVARIALESLGGFTVEICNDGHQALEIAPVFHPDLLLLDVMMPGMDGPATLSALRELQQTASTPAIFMTAKVQPSEIEELMQHGALGVISKPFDPMTLADQINNLVNQPSQ